MSIKRIETSGHLTPFRRVPSLIHVSQGVRALCRFGMISWHDCPPIDFFPDYCTLYALTITHPTSSVAAATTDSDSLPLVKRQQARLCFGETRCIVHIPTSHVYLRQPCKSVLDRKSPRRDEDLQFLKPVLRILLSLRLPCHPQEPRSPRIQMFLLQEFVAPRDPQKHLRRARKEM